VRVTRSVVGVAVLAATSFVLGTASPAAAAPARSTVAAKLSTASVLTGARVSVSGSVRPKGIRNVTLQRLSGRTWVTVARQRTTSAGSYRLPFTASQVGTPTYRVNVAKTRTRAGVVSTALRLRVRPLPPARGGYVYAPLGSPNKLYAVPLAKQPGGTRLVYSGGDFDFWETSDRGLFALLAWSGKGVSSLVIGVPGRAPRTVRTHPANNCISDVDVSADGTWVVYHVGGTAATTNDRYGCDGADHPVVYNTRTGTIRDLGATVGGRKAYAGFWAGTGWLVRSAVVDGYLTMTLQEAATGRLVTPNLAGCLGACANPQNLPTPAGTLAYLGEVTPENPTGQWLLHLNGTPPTRNTAVTIATPHGMIASPDRTLATWSAPAARAAANSPLHVWVGKVDGSGARDIGMPNGEATWVNGWAGNAYVYSQPMRFAAPIQAAVTPVGGGAPVYQGGMFQANIRGVWL
jgi:hypothetical protein